MNNKKNLLQTFFKTTMKIKNIEKKKKKLIPFLITKQH